MASSTFERVPSFYFCTFMVTHALHPVLIDSCMLRGMWLYMQALQSKFHISKLIKAFKFWAYLSCAKQSTAKGRQGSLASCRLHSIELRCASLRSMQCFWICLCARQGVVAGFYIERKSCACAVRYDKCQISEPSNKRKNLLEHPALLHACKLQAAKCV